MAAIPVRVGPGQYKVGNKVISGLASQADANARFNRTPNNPAPAPAPVTPAAPAPVAETPETGSTIPVRVGAGQYKINGKIYSGMASPEEALKRSQRTPNNPENIKPTPTTGGPLVAETPAVAPPLETPPEAQAPTPTPPPEAAPVPAPKGFQPPAETFLPSTNVVPTLEDFNKGFSAYNFIPQKYEANPLYNWQKEEGLKSLEKLNASRGLTGSGAEGELAAKFLGQLGATEADKARAFAQSEAARFDDHARSEAARYDKYAQDEATRRYNIGNDQWNRIMDVMKFQGEQNPYKSGVEALNNSNAASTDQGKINADYLSKLFNTVIPNRVASSGGSSGPGAFVPPAPSGPDNTLSSLFGLMSGQKSNNDWLSTGINALSKLF